ncbi:unnamed protein product [Brassica rapa subsp. narinosa]
MGFTNGDALRLSPSFSLKLSSSKSSSFNITRVFFLVSLKENMGVLDHVSEMFDCSHGHKIKKRRQLQTVEIKVKMDCEGCERKVRRSVEGMKGVSSVSLEPKAHKVTVVGYVDPNKVVELWPYVPYDVVAHPYAAGVYDKKAPSGYVRRADDPGVSQLARASSTEVRYTTAFSDENPAACVLM